MKVCTGRHHLRGVTCRLLEYVSPSVSSCSQQKNVQERFLYGMKTTTCPETGIPQYWSLGILQNEVECLWILQTNRKLGCSVCGQDTFSGAEQNHKVPVSRDWCHTELNVSDESLKQVVRQAENCLYIQCNVDYFILSKCDS